MKLQSTAQCKFTL